LIRDGPLLGSRSRVPREINVLIVLDGTECNGRVSDERKNERPERVVV
jgi:hypothetical protein